MICTVTGAGGFIGGHLVQRLLNEGHTVRAFDIKPLGEWHQINDYAINYDCADVSDEDVAYRACQGSDEVYNLAADMGGMGFIENNKLDCMLSVLPSTAMLIAASEMNVPRFFYSSSACVYPGRLQKDEAVWPLKESDAYPADPEDGYGWEKLFTERMCRHFREETGLQTRIGRYHNVYGPWGTWDGGREKAPAALCRKVATAKLTGLNELDIWGDGEQTRSFLYVSDCVEGTIRLMRSAYVEPVNIGSSVLVSINQLLDIIEQIAGTRLVRNHVAGPLGVRGRNSDNTLCESVLGWGPKVGLEVGLADLYYWVEAQVTASLSGLADHQVITAD